MTENLVIPKKNPPSPAVQDFQVLFVNILFAALDLGADALQALCDGPGHPERHLVGEDVQHRKDEEGDCCKPPSTGQRCSDASDQGPALAKCIFGVVGALFLSCRSAEDGSYGGDEGAPGTAWLSMKHC